MGIARAAVGVTLPHAGGAAYANRLAIRYGHSEGSGRDPAASCRPTSSSSFPPFR